MRMEAIRVLQVVAVFFLAAAIPNAHATDIAPAITAHLRTIVGDLPIRDSEDAIDISAYRDVTDPESSNRYKFVRVAPTETRIRASESLSLKITTKSPGDLIAYIHGNPDPFWFHLKQGKNGRQAIQISSGLPLSHCGKRQFHVYIFQMQEKQLLVWHRDIDGGYLACEIGP